MTTQDTTFEVGDTTYALRYTANALVKLEEHLGKPVPKILAEFTSGNGGLRQVQAIFWAGLEGHRMKTKSRSRPYTIEETGDLIDDLGGFVQASDLLAAAIARNLGTAEDTESSGGNGRAVDEDQHPTPPPG